MEQADIIIIGAGAAGMMAAHTLAGAGRKVIVLEARNRTGGRIHTIDHALFFRQAELGAEFIHGDLPVTLGLLKEAGLEAEPAGGEMWRCHDGHFTQDEMMGDDWNLLLEKLNELREDSSLNEFLDKYFSDDRFNELKATVRRYLAGYDTGDPDRAGVFALRREWENEDEGAQHRIKGGYCALINYLQQSCRHAGGVIYLNAAVKQVNWLPGKARAVTAAGEMYEAPKVIVALPLGVLQQPGEAGGNIRFEPALPGQTGALQQMGFGEIIKILLRFETAFWEEDALRNMGFLFSDEAVPTWWTQAPNHTPLLTGWLGGLPAGKIKHQTDEKILEAGLQSLARIFNRSADGLKGMLVAWQVANWSADPYSCGSYAYDTVASSASRALLNEGVSSTIYFAGEYLYEGTAMGTVEAALISGRYAAAQVLKNL